MAEDKMIHAKKMYETLCTALDNRKWKYQKDEEKLVAYFGVNGDDLPMDMIVMVDAERQLVRLLSPLSYKMPEDKLIDGAIAACVASYGLNDGNFDYDISEGRIVFRLTVTYVGSDVTESLLQYMISCACSVVDAYNDKFLAVGKGLMSITDFIKAENQ